MNTRCKMCWFFRHVWGYMYHPPISYSCERGLRSYSSKKGKSLRLEVLTLFLSGLIEIFELNGSVGSPSLKQRHNKRGVSAWTCAYLTISVSLWSRLINLIPSEYPSIHTSTSILESAVGNWLLSVGRTHRRVSIDIFLPIESSIFRHRSKLFLHHY